MEDLRHVPIIESYDTEEEYLYAKPYCFIKGFATCGNFENTLKALPLARKAHNGQYRNGLSLVNGKQVKLPYILHPLKVCSTLISLNLPIDKHDLDILYTCAILHDVYEDCPKLFQQNGDEFTNIYGFPKEVKEIILLLSKHSGCTPEELRSYFNQIKKNRIASLIKLADRSHNVEDLYEMIKKKKEAKTVEEKFKRFHKYTTETREYIYPLAAYMKQNYPELSNGVTILKSKIVSLTEAAEAFADIIQSIN